MITERDLRNTLAAGGANIGRIVSGYEDFSHVHGFKKEGLPFFVRLPMRRW
jgi:hypothetical protein